MVHRKGGDDRGVLPGLLAVRDGGRTAARAEGDLSEIAGFDDYTSLYFPGGILNVAIARVAYAAMGRDDRNEFAPDARPAVLPSVPVVDEDGDGELADEIPDYPRGANRFTDTEATYADGRARTNLYWQATHEHLANGILTNEVITKSRHRDLRRSATTSPCWDSNT